MEADAGETSGGRLDFLGQEIERSEKERDRFATLYLFVLFLMGGALLYSALVLLGIWGVVLGLLAFVYLVFFVYGLFQIMYLERLKREREYLLTESGKNND